MIDEGRSEVGASGRARGGERGGGTGPAHSSARIGNDLGEWTSCAL